MAGGRCGCFSERNRFAVLDNMALNTLQLDGFSD